MTLKLKYDRDNDTLTVDVLAVGGASLMSIASILTPLTILRQVAPEISLRVQTILYGSHKQSELGLELSGNIDFDTYAQSIQNNDPPHVLFVVCGTDVNPELRAGIRRLMRNCLRHYIPLVCIGSATWLLAEIGGLQDRNCVIHWNSDFAFAERNPETTVTVTLFESDLHLASCAGETATLDFTLSLVGETLGPAIQKKLCDQMLIGYPRGAKSIQPGARANRLHHFPPILQEMVRLMQANLETPLKLSELSRKFLVSQRQIERIFSKHLGISPRNYYFHLQLDAAFQLCEQTEMPITEIAIACGFSSSSNFARRFRERFGMTPKKFRK